MNSVWKIFRAPLALALISLIGLFSALLADGLWDVVSWMSLGAVVGVVIHFSVHKHNQKPLAIKPEIVNNLNTNCSHLDY